MLEPSDEVANKASVNSSRYRHKQGQIVGQITRFAIGLSILGYSIPAVAVPTCTIGDGTADPNITEYISSVEVYGGSTAARTLTDSLDDPWRAAILPQTSPSWTGTNTNAIANNESNLITINGVNTDVAFVNVDATGDCTGVVNTGAVPQLTNSATLQGTAPRPSSLTTGSYWNESGGDANNRNGVLFTFSRPVSAFGAWFGDLETRTDGSGTPARLRLLDPAGNRIGRDIQIVPTTASNGTTSTTINQRDCGGNFNGCGNNSTRWIGFVDTTARVKQVLVIVGDDDALGAVSGNGEHLSFIGVNLVSPTISGTVFEDMNYGGGAGRPLSTPATSPRSNARVEIYDGSGIFKAATTTDSNGFYKFSSTNVPGGIMGGANYTVRVVNSSVTSSRSGYTSALLPVQTFRTNGLTNNVGTADPNRVGGEAPQLIDAGNGSTTFGDLTTATTKPESMTSVTVGSADATGIDFGFNFDTIVNTNDSGQGSLRQFILNSNDLHAESNLAQFDQPAGYETSIFMIPNGVANPGQNTSTGYVSQLNTSGIAVINLSTALPSISDTKTRLDGATQTTNVKTSGSLETNSGQIGTGGTVGVGKIPLAMFDRPEIEIKGAYLLTATGSFAEIKNIAFNEGRVAISGNNSLVKNNLIGMKADGTGDNYSYGTFGITAGAGSNITIDHNYVRVNNSGIRRDGNGTNLIVEYNEVDAPSVGHGITYDGILIIGSGTNDIIRNNLTKYQRGGGIELGFTNGTLINTLVENNTVWHNGYYGASFSTPSTETMGVAAYALTTNSSVVFSKNIIAESSGSGVVVMNAAGIKFTQNSIFKNGASGNSVGLSIDLDANTRDPNDYTGSTTQGVTPNNGTVSATLPNGEMNYPIFTKAQRVLNTLKLKGYIGINPAGNTAFANATIEIYKADNSSDTNQNGEVIASDTQSKPHGEGRYYIGTITADPNGLFDTTLTIPTSLTDGITDTTLGLTDKITAIATSSATATITPNSTSEFSEDIPITAGNSNILLVKRITEISGLSFTGYEDSPSRYDDNILSVPTALETRPDTDKWPNPPSSFLRGKIDGGRIKPTDTIEYTIYFISAGDDAAKDVFICDRVPTNVTFLETAFNSLTPNSTALPGADRGIAIDLGGDLKSYTNAGGDDLARYFPPNQEPIYNDYAQFFPGATPTFLAKKICDAPNTNGAIVVNLGTVPNAIGAGDPPESSGFVRFQGKVKD